MTALLRCPVASYNINIVPIRFGLVCTQEQETLTGEKQSQTAFSAIGAHGHLGEKYLMNATVVTTKSCGLCSALKAPVTGQLFLIFANKRE